MQTSNNTILISGGTAGIGFEIAKLLTAKGNHVIITGRNKQRLEAAAAKLENVTPIVFDVTNSADTAKLAERLAADFPNLNVLINNAGMVHLHNLGSDTDIAARAAEEMDTNYFSVIRLTEKLLPLLRRQPAAAIVNVSSIVAIAPSGKMPTYSASKAAVHSYTEALRLALTNTPVKVFELMPPLVATEFSKEIGGLENGIPASQVAAEFFNAFTNDEFEIHVGATAQIYSLARTSPAAALQALNS